jgi:hypothetical protein
MRAFSRRTETCFGFAVVVSLSFLFLLPATAQSYELKIWPGSLKPTSSYSAFYQSFDRLKNTSSNKAIEFYSVINLRPGKTITKVSWYRSAFAANPSLVSLVKFKMGQQPTLLGFGYSVSDTGGNIVEESVSVTPEVVSSQYRYMIKVFIDYQHTNTSIHGVKLTYE